MGVQRTREQKEKAQARREQVAYTWSKSEEHAKTPSSKVSSVRVHTSRSPVSEDGFQIDMRRTLLSFAACLLVLAVVYILRG